MSTYQDIYRPPITIKNDLLETYVKLYQGIRDRSDPVSWRTFIVDTKILLGSRDPQHHSLSPSKFSNAKKLVKSLTKDTYLQPLTDEIYYALGFRNKLGKNDKKIDVLIFNGRHQSQPLLWTLADNLKNQGKIVAVVNPVGHYNDNQCRIISPFKLSSSVEKMVILASTQEIYGGNIAVLANVIRTLANPEFSRSIKEVDIVIPMFGGSRGHRLGQSEELGYEVLEAIFNAKILTLVTEDVLAELAQTTKNPLPQIRFLSIDIHSHLYPSQIFTSADFQFISISPAIEIANTLYQHLQENHLLDTPIRLIACDKGAITRVELLAIALLKHPQNILQNLDIIYIDKVRQKAGIVDSAKVKTIIRWSLKSDQIVKEKLPLKKVDYHPYVLCYTDDMIDTGGTAKKDIELLSLKFPNTLLKVFASTHPIFSQGYGALDTIGADLYLIGNTLSPPNLLENKKIKIVDLGPAIAREIYW